MLFKYNDGGRELAGFKGSAGDCVTRAITIVTGKAYKEVYDELFSEIKEFTATKRSKAAKKAARGGGLSGTTPSNGISKEVYHKYLIENVGMIWCPTMLVGQGCKVHLVSNELPSGKLIARVAKHLTAVIDGVINDVLDCSYKCVYGYYYFPSFKTKLKIGQEVNFQGSNTVIISFMPERNKYLLAGFGSPVSFENITLISKE